MAKSDHKARRSTAPRTARRRPNVEIPTVALKAIEEVSFKGLFTVRLALGKDGRKKIVPSEIAETLGLGDRGIEQRVERNLRKGMCKMHLPSSGGEQLANALDLKYLPALLLGISVNAVAEHLRPRLEEIQEELHEALYNYSFNGVAVNEGYVKDAPQDERDAIAEKVRGVVSDELVPVRESNDAILAEVRRLPVSIEGIGASLRPHLYDIILDAGAPLASRVQELYNRVIAFVDSHGREVIAIRDGQAKLAAAIAEMTLAQERHRGETITAIIKLREQNDAIAIGLLRTHDLNTDTNKRLIEFAGRDGRITELQAAWLRGALNVLAQKMLRAGLAKKVGSEKSAHSDLVRRLFDLLSWGGEGETLDNIEAKEWQVVKRFIERETRAVDQKLKRRGAKPARPRASKAQRELFAAKPENKPN